jgi:hypothetical protein
MEKSHFRWTSFWGAGHSLSRVMQSLKQSVARTLALRAADPFWQARYYDFNVWSEHKFVEKLRYIHRNPVTRGLVALPDDWVWSSFRHYANGEVGRVEIESQWTARRREQAGIFPTVRKHPAGGWPTLSLISTPEGAPSLSRFLRQGGDVDFPNCGRRMRNFSGCGLRSAGSGVTMLTCRGGSSGFRKHAVYTL